MSAEPVLEAFGPDGQRWPDPSEDLLFMLLEDLVKAGLDAKMLVQRLDTPSEECMFILHTGNGFGVLRKDSDGTAVSACADMRDVHAALTYWAFRLGERTLNPAAQAHFGGWGSVLDWHPVADS